MKRRAFLSLLTGSAAAAALPVKAKAAGGEFKGHPDNMAVLTDLTKCIGCRKCEKAFPGKFKVEGFLAHVCYEAKEQPTAEDIETVKCPTGALLTAARHQEIETIDPEYSLK